MFRVSVAQSKLIIRLEKLYMVVIVLKYKKYNLIILLLCILWVVGHYRNCYLKLHEIDEKYRV